MSLKAKRIIVAVAIAFVLIITVTLVLVFTLIEKVPEKYINKWYSSMPYNASNCSTVVIPEGKDLVILQLTDIHYDFNNNRKEDTLRLINDIIERSHADVITVTGDWTSQTEGTKEHAKIVFDTINAHGIPWAPVFGNHDMEGELSRYDYADMFAEYSLCLFKAGYSNIGGVGNYVVNIREGSPGGKLVKSLIMIDSNTSYSKGEARYRPIDKRQVEWYKWTVDGLNEVYRTDNSTNEIIPTLAFFHIPLIEFDIVNNSNNIIYGKNDEKPCVPDRNTGLFDAILEKNSTKAIFVGHDHANNAIADYKGIQLSYGVQSGWCEGYADENIKGGNLITFNTSNKLIIQHLIFENYSK